MSIRKAKIWIILSIGIWLLASFSSQPPRGRTGAPDEPSCAAVGCHIGSNPAIQGRIEVDGFPATGIRNESFNITVSLISSSDAVVRGGFQLVALGDSSGTLINVGSFSNPESEANVTDFNDRIYFEHSPAKTFGNDSIVTYTARWTTPDIFNVDSITLYAASVFANGNGGPTMDRVVTQAFGIPMFFQNDQDQDGFTADVDCDDLNELINPAAEEIPNNEFDENCDGDTLMIDIDMDGFNSDIDCDDRDSLINPDATEIANNGIDENCDGIQLIIDVDMDGFNSDDDCDDDNAAINPDAIEVPDNDIDENCDGEIVYLDKDSDGFDSDVDCDDNDDSINPDATEILDNDIDENCDGRKDSTGIMPSEFTYTGMITNSADLPIGGVEIRNKQTQTLLGTSAANGTFSITLSDSATVELVKDADPREGLTVTDITIMINHLLGKTPIDNPQLLNAGDTNGSGSISVADIALIQSILLQRSTDFPNSKPWVFEPADFLIQAEGASDFKAYKIGDLNNSASRE